MSYQGFWPIVFYHYYICVSLQFLFLFPFLASLLEVVYMSACTQTVCVGGGGGSYKHVCMYGARSQCGNLPHSLSNLLFETVFHWTWGALTELDQLAKLRDLTVCTPQVLELQTHATAPGFLCSCLVIELRLSYFEKKHLLVSSVHPGVLFVYFITVVCIYSLSLLVLTHTPQLTLQSFG